MIFISLIFSDELTWINRLLTFNKGESRQYHFLIEISKHHEIIMSIKNNYISLSGKQNKTFYTGISLFMLITASKLQ